MNIARRLMPCLLAVLLIAGLAGCATKQEVTHIVADTNAAFVSPYLEAPKTARKGNAWKEPVERIDRLIAQYPDQKKLVNHLRVRQAMLLTVYEQGNLAEERWKAVEDNELTTERDQSLHACWRYLVWWYKRAGIFDPLDAKEMQKAEKALSKLDETMKNVGQGSDIHIYLGTIRAQIALKIANDSDVSTPENEAQVQKNLVASLEAYALLFDQQEDKDWIENNKNTDGRELRSIKDFRYRIWLREMIKGYKETARSFGMQPIWKPDWVNNLNVD